ncbi:lipoprotein [Spiroplasma endosymbiont of Panorpa germanica]|uniref:lipoprotein n=1 Tax=Spiroplasma endosymbiont of Panorpa germanica TaxID=3066314 RepID=UPI0030D45C79
MKKLLSILGAFTLTASTSLSVISCTIPKQRVEIFVGKSSEKDNFKSFNGPTLALTSLTADILNVLNFKKEMYPDDTKYKEQKELRQNKEGKLFSFEELFTKKDPILTGAAKDDFWREYNEPFNTSFSQVSYEKNTEDSAFQNLGLTVIRSIVPDGKTDKDKIQFLRADSPTSDKELKDFEKHKARTAKILVSDDLKEGINGTIDQMKKIDNTQDLKLVQKDKDDKEITLYKVSDQEVLTPYTREVEFKADKGKEKITQTIVAPDVGYSFEVNDFEFETIFNGNESKYRISTTISGLSGIIALTAASASSDDNTEKINANFYWYLKQYQFNNEKMIGYGSPENMSGKFDNLDIKKIDITKV